MRGLGHIWLLLLLSGAPSTARAEPLDLDELAKGTQTKYFGTDKLGAVPLGISLQAPPATVLGEGRFLQTWLSCVPDRCLPKVSIAGPGPPPSVAITVLKTLALPILDKKPLESIEFRAIPLVEWPGASRQAVLRYTVTSGSRPGLGPLRNDYLAIVNLPDLRLALFARVGYGGTLDVDQNCTFLPSRDDGALVFTPTCDQCTADMMGCKRTPPAQAFRWNARARKYLPVKVGGGRKITAPSVK